jgi:hypothetical protein
VAKDFYIYGYYGSKNAGDEAFRLAFRKLLPKEARLTFIRPSELAGNQTLSSQIKKNIHEGLARLIVGGGAIIGEPYFWEHIPASTPYHIVSADIGSQDQLLERYQSSLSQLQSSWIRSETDTEQLLSLAPKGSVIHYMPDIVFCLEATPSVRKSVASMETTERNQQLLKRMQHYCENTMGADQLRKKNMAVFLSDHYYDYKTIRSTTVLEGIEREASDKLVVRRLRQAFDELTTYYNLYFFSLSYWHNAIDAFTSYRIARTSTKAPLYNITSRYIEPEIILDLMPYFDAAISTKFHGLILPMTAGVPVMNLGTSKKNHDLVQQMRLVSLNPDELTVTSFLSALKTLESAEYSTTLTETTRLAKELIITTLSNPDLWD